MKRFGIAACALLLSALPVYAQVSVRTLPSGAKLIVDRETTAKDTVIEAFFRVGTADENAAGDSGMSALLANTWTYAGQNRTASEIARDIGRFGDIGAWTTGEYIELWAESATDSSDTAAQTLLMNLVAAPAFPREAVIGAKRAIDRQRSLRAEDLLSDSYAELRRRVFALSSAGRDPLGDEDAVLSATPEHLRRFYLRTVGFDASRAVFVVAGNIDPDDAQELVTSNLDAGDWPALHPASGQPVIASSDEADRIPAGFKMRDLKRPAPERLLLVGFVAPGTAAGPKDWASLQLLDAVMAGGKDCRLFALRDRPGDNALPIGYDIRSRLESGHAQSLWSVFVTGTTRDASTVRDAIVAETKALAEGTRPITDDELARAKTYLIGRHRHDRQRLQERASALGLAEVTGLGATFESDYEAQINAVSLDDVNAMAKTVFTGNAASIVTGTEPPTQ